MNIHGVRKLNARPHSEGSCHWVTIECDIEASDASVTMFFPDTFTAHAYASAINAVKPAPVEQQEAA